MSTTDNDMTIIVKYCCFLTAGASGAAHVGISFGECEKLSKKLYVGNLSFDATEEQVSELFAQYGKVDSIAMINDRDTGRFRGFCFVEMEDSAANASINALNDSELDGRTLRVNEARPREDRKGGNSYNNRQGNKYGQGGGNSW